MSLTRFVVRGADNAELQISSASFPATIAIADLEPKDGSFPTFSENPIVYVINATTTRNMAVTAIDYTAGTNGIFTLSCATSGGPPGTYTVDIGIETADTPAAAPVSTSASIAPYYCSPDDVKDLLLAIGDSAIFDSGEKFSWEIRRKLIRQAYGKIQAALAQGGYDLPIENSTIYLFTNDPAAGTSVSLSLASGNDVTALYPIARTVRVHSTISTIFTDEFTTVIGHASTTQMTVANLVNNHTSNGTVELCTEGFLFLHQMNAMGAAGMTLGSSVASQGTSENIKVNDYMASFKADLKKLESGSITLDGLTKTNQIIKTYQTENDTAQLDLEPEFPDNVTF